MDQTVTRSSIVLIVMLVIGLHALLTGWRYHRGSYKSPYFGRATFNLYAELGITAGLLFVILSISSLLTRDMTVSEGATTAVAVLTYLAMLALALNWLLGLLSSELLKPSWVIWLENHYDKSQIEQLRQQAQGIGLRQWETLVRTQSDLEAWITAVLPSPPPLPKSAPSADNHS